MAAPRRPAPGENRSTAALTALPVGAALPEHAGPTADAAARAAAERRPILVTGAHRSGTTWVGTMLALSHDVGMIHEPWNPLTPPGVSPMGFDRFFQYVCADNEDAYVGSVERMLGFHYNLGPQLRALRSPKEAARAARDLASFTRSRLAHARPLVKDPIAVFSSEWLASRFEMQVVVLIRHPAAFASSIRRLGWTHRFDRLLDQPLLLRDHLGPFEAEIRDYATHERDPLDQAILLWRMIYATVLGFRERRPEWLYVRHEDLSLDPPEAFASLFGQLGVGYDERLREQVARHSASENPQEQRHKHSVTLDSRANITSWKRRLAPDEIERIRAGVADVSPSFYDDEDW